MTVPGPGSGISTTPRATVTPPVMPTRSLRRIPLSTTRAGYRSVPTRSRLPVTLPSMQLHRDELRGQTRQVGALRMTPIGRDTRLGFAGRRVALAAGYARPREVEIEGPRGRTTLRVPDRQLQLRLLLAALPLLYVLFKRRTR